MKPGDVCRIVTINLFFYYPGFPDRLGFYYTAEHIGVKEIVIFLGTDSNSNMGIMAILLTQYGIRLIQRSLLEPIDQPQ